MLFFSDYPVFILATLRCNISNITLKSEDLSENKHFLTKTFGTFCVKDNTMFVFTFLFQYWCARKGCQIARGK
jgi:hypothetical protein